MKKTKIIVADDHNSMLDLLKSYFNNHPEIEIVGVATHGEQALSLVRTLEPDGIILDIGMPGLNGVETAKRLIKDHPNTFILILSFHNEIFYIRNLKEMGVHGYLLKESGMAEIENAVKILANGGLYFSKAVREIETQEKLRKTDKPEIQFTNREKIVLGGLAKGWSNDEIATQMKVMNSTIETHLKNIREKTGLNSQRQLVVFAKDHQF